MPSAHHRKKAPDDVRNSLLSAALTLAAESGAQAVTIDAVSKRAGVTKGGLQHHFPSRKALIDALFAEVWGNYRAWVDSLVEQDDVAEGRLTRAYLHTNDAKAHEDEQRLSRACAALLLAEPGFRSRWAEMTGQLLPSDEAPTLEGQARLVICRLAADGLWLADLLGIHAHPPELRSELMRQLDELTKLKEAP